MIMFRKLAVVSIVVVLCLATTLVFADAYTQYSSVWATSNRRLATRTGPGTQYDEPGSFNQAGVQYKILSKAYDDRNGIWWVQVEITTKDGVIWGYTGVKRFDNLNLSLIPEEKVIGRCRTSYSTPGYYAPVSNACPIQRNIPANVECNIYGYCYGEGSDYILIEFYDAGIRQYRRAWVPDPFVDDYEMYYGF